MKTTFNNVQSIICDRRLFIEEISILTYLKQIESNGCNEITIEMVIGKFYKFNQRAIQHAINNLEKCGYITISKSTISVTKKTQNNDNHIQR